MDKLDFGELSMLDEFGKRLGLSSDDVKKSVKDTPREDLGDIAIESFILSKKLWKDPKETSEYIKEKLGGTWFIKKMDVYGPYLNISYDYDRISATVLSSINDSYGKINVGNEEKIFLEHTSVNPNKALHIGHAKNACIGDSLGRLLRFVNYKTIVANYVDDTGAQVADDIVGIKFLNMPEQKDGVKLDIYLGNEVYVNTTKAYENDPSLLEKRRLVLKSIEEGNNEIAKFAMQLVSKVLSSQMETFDRLKIYYDLFNHESHILSYKFWETAFKQLKDRNLIRYSEEGDKAGCWVFPMEDARKRIYEKILVRSDGTVVYAGKDIAYAMWKHGLLNADFRYKKLQTQANGQTLWESTDENIDIAHPKFNDIKTSITLVDKRQSDEQEVVKQAVDKMAGDKQVNYIHYAYEIVSLSQNTAKRMNVQMEEDERTFNMSGRKGIVVNVDTFLDMLYTKVYEETKNKNPDMNDEECKKVAESIAVSTFRYELVKTDPSRITVFDVDDALKLEARNAIYIIYTYARASSILNKAQLRENNINATDLEAKEKRIIRMLTKFPTAVFDSVNNLYLTTLSTYISSLCFEFNSFYESLSVLNADERKRDFRISLVKAVKEVLKNGMDLLGLIPLERI